VFGSMPQSPHITEFIDDMVRTQGRTHEDVMRELVEVASGAVVAHFGDATPIEVVIEGYDVCVFQVIDVVDTVTNPKREMTLLAAKGIAPEVTTGEQLALPIRYTYAAEDVASADVPWKDSVPLPVYDVALWDVLTRHLNRALQRYYPPRQHTEGTLGHLLAANGAWMRGVVGRSGNTQVAITGAFLDVSSITPTREWTDYGFDLEVRTAGVTRSLRIERGDNEGNVRDQFKLPVGEASRGELEQALADLAAEIENEIVRPLDEHLPADWNDKLKFINGHTWTPRIMHATLKRPVPGSLMDYLGTALPSALGDYSCRVPLDGGAVTFRTIRVFPPEIGLGDFGRGSLRLAAEIEGGEPAPDFGDYTGDVLPLGAVSFAALDRPGPQTPDEVADVQAILATHRKWLDANLHEHAKRTGLDGYTSMSFFYAFLGYFPLLDLIEQRLTMGPPGPPPVPAFSDDALALAGRMLMPVRGDSLTELARMLKMKLPGEVPENVAQSAIIAAYAANGWRLVLADEYREGPFRIPEISILPPEGGRAATVMMVDAWNPQARTVVDGDAFAFRRFLTWLREGILRGGHDQVARFENSNEDGEDEGDAGESAITEIKISEWLLFEMPDFGDRFLVDWRGQWHVVNAVAKVEDFAGIYGFSREYLEQLREHDIPTWRRFLREVIDPRFDATVGARLAR
jgi:hypothetical protein